MSERVKEHLLISVLGFLLFIPFLGSVHLFDWDEINFAESAREMLVTGKWYLVQINFDPFWEKPPLFFWLQALSMKVFGVNEFAARFPNALVGLATLNLIWHIGKRHFGTKQALYWVLLMLASITPHFYFKSGIIDPLYNLLIFSAIYQIFLSEQQGTSTLRMGLIGLFLGLAVLTKGPVALLIVGLVVVGFLVVNRFKFWFGILDFLIVFVTTLVLVLIWLAPELINNGSFFLVNFIRYQWELFSQPVASHGQPWFYHPLVLLFGCFPASIISFHYLLKRKVSHPFDRWMQLLFWVVLVVFSLVTTKIVHYSSLCYLPLTFLAARGVDTWISEYKPRKWLNWIFAGVGLLLLVAFVGLVAIGIYQSALLESLGFHLKDPLAIELIDLGNPWPWYFFIIPTLFLFGSTYLLYSLNRNKTHSVAYALLICMVFISTFITLVVPRIEAKTQGPIIGFLEDLEGEDCYIQTFGHKSYAHYFYPKIGLDESSALYQLKKELEAEIQSKQSMPLSLNQKKDVGRKLFDWLCEGDIDKKAYIICKERKLTYMQGFEGMELVFSKGGYYVFLRNP